MMRTIEKVKKQLAKVELQLDKCRTSTINDGWQTQRFAKKSRKWDFYAQQKMRLIQEIEDIEALQEKRIISDEFGGL
jgi:hypothetical protein